MIALFTDYSLSGPYVGLLKAVFAQHCPEVKVLDVCHDLPAFDPEAASYLLTASLGSIPSQAIIVGVVDPGVGSQREALWLTLDGQHFIGPNNGLFTQSMVRAKTCEARELLFDQDAVSQSFHGRDVFAPAAADLINSQTPVHRKIANEKLVLTTRSSTPNSTKVIYIDGFGNCMLSVWREELSVDTEVKTEEQTLLFARTFSEVNPGDSFWYFNSLGLVEVACREGSAAEELDLKIGSELSFQS